MSYEAIIVGGGVMGLSAALALLKSGLRRVAVLERFRVGHASAASVDTTRAIRFEYAGAELYSRMVGRSVEAWRELEQAAGIELYINSGVVCWGRGDASHARLSHATLSHLGIEIEELSPEDLCRRFPQFSSADISYATYNREGGFLWASRCVGALAAEVRRLGGEIREECRVTGLRGHGPGRLAVQLSDEQLLAERVVLTPGPWGAKLLPQLGLVLPLTAHKQQVVYLSGLGSEFAPGAFPVFLNLDHDLYGFPLDYNGLLKAALHLAGPTVDPDADLVPDRQFTERTLALLRAYIPATADARLVAERLCMYAMTPDEDFILDRLPGLPGVVVGAGFSGHGFKFGPVIGGLLADLLLDMEPEFPMQSFSLSRPALIHGHAV